jgi:antibiotic biosynthesis monooxygenase (ABM) superfamily enzyme
MTVFLVSTYTVKDDNRKKHLAWGKKLVATIKTHPDLFREVQSLRVFCEKTGDTNRHIALWEFQSQADKVQWEKRFRSSPEAEALTPEFLGLIVQGTFVRRTWQPIKTLRRASKTKSIKP